MIAFSKLLVIGVLLIHVTMYSGITAQGTSKCSTLPQVQHRLSAVIVDCQNQVKEDMIRDALQQIRIAEQQQPQQYPPSASEQMLINSALAQNREDIHWMVKRFKRDVVDGNMFDHPTIMSPEDKEIAGVRIKGYHSILFKLHSALLITVSHEVLFQKSKRVGLLRLPHFGRSGEFVYEKRLGS